MENFSIRKTYIYRKLASIKTSVILLFILLVFFLIGTIFPQGVSPEKYEEAKGRFLFAAKYLGFLHIFETPGFFLFSILLAVNTIICTMERAISLTKRKNPLSLSGGGWRRPVSILFHSGIFICLVAFFGTHIFSYENYITLKKGEVSEVSLPGGEVAPFDLRLNGFYTLYEESPKLKLPGDRYSKVRAILAGVKKRAKFTVGEEDIAVSDWISDISVISKDIELKRKKVEVNGPLKHGGITFYQMGFDQEVTIAAGEKEIKVEPRKPFKIEGLGDISISHVKHGTLRRLDGKNDDIKPFFYVYGPKKGGKREKLGRVKMGESARIKGNPIRFIHFDEKSVLSYRIDPSVTVLYYVSFLVIGLIALRLYV